MPSNCLTKCQIILQNGFIQTCLER
ncbi:hypothetical protein ACSQ67_009124 [Phaseolus vulgaris]